MRIPVFDSKGGRTEEILEFDEKIFGDRVYRVALKNSIIMFEARQRLGTHSTKTRKECSGSGRKLWRQKGTGRARVGAARAPQWRGGGRVFGPHPRDYSYSIPKKEKKRAMDSAWLAKAREKKIMVIEGFELDKTPKTSIVIKTLKSMGLVDVRVLVGVSEPNEVLLRSVSNIPKVSMEDVTRFGPHLIIENDTILLLKKSFEKIVKDRGGEIKILNRKDVYKK